MKFLQLCIIALGFSALVSCENENNDGDDMDDEDMEMTISEETKQKSTDIGIAVGEEKDMNGDGVADVMLDANGNLIILNGEDEVTTEVDSDGEMETEVERSYELEYNEKKGKWEIDTENDIEQAAEDVGDAVSNAAKDVGDAAEDVFDGDED